MEWTVKDDDDPITIIAHIQKDHLSLRPFRTVWIIGDACLMDGEAPLVHIPTLIEFGQAHTHSP